MGNSNSKSNNSSKHSATFVPNSFLQCMDQDGSISTELHYLYQRRKRQKERTESFGRVIRDSIDTAYDMSGMDFGSDHTIDDEGSNDDNDYFSHNTYNNTINDNNSTEIVHVMHHCVFHQKL
jgi:hypothetical protein